MGVLTQKVTRPVGRVFQIPCTAVLTPPAPCADMPGWGRWALFRLPGVSNWAVFEVRLFRSFCRSVRQCPHVGIIVQAGEKKGSANGDIKHGQVNMRDG